MFTRESKFVHSGINMTVIETFQPTSLGEVIHRDSEARHFAQRMACDTYEAGNGSVSLRGQMLSPRDYLLNVDIDLSNNKRMMRDLNLAATYNRLAALFGAGSSNTNETRPARGAGQAPEATVTAQYDSLPASVLGDICRAIGYYIGYSIDFLVLSFWSFFQKSSVTDP